MTSKLGGGIEVSLLCYATFLAGTRQKFFYYVAWFTMDKFLTNTMKLVYAQPRPYMYSQNFQALGHCSKEFGNPSGHSLSSMLFAIGLFLDTFHGASVKSLNDNFNKINQEDTYKKKTGKQILNYCFWLVIAVFYALIMPVSRFLQGMHSLD